MPPLSKTPYKLERTPELQTGLHLDILESQRSDTSGYLADTSLMCQGGTIKVHAFILQAASTFFRAAFTSQGAEYPHVREVMLPDFTVHEMEAMLSLIYKGTVNLSSDEEITLLKNTLKFFGVTAVDFKSVQKKEPEPSSNLEIDGNLYVNRFSRIPDSMKTEATEESFREEIEVVTVQEGERRRLSNPPRTCNVAKSPVASTSSIPNGMKKPKLILPRILPQTSSSSTSVPPPPPQVAAVIPPKNPIKKKKKKGDPDDEETDEEDKDWSEPNFKDTAWFKREALKCQVCDTGYPQVKDVLDCISKHSKQNVRCCFCLRVYPNTEVLYRHYAKRHKSAGRENTIMCHFCDQALSYNAVSSHVISAHFKIVSESETPAADPVAAPPKTKQSPTKSTSSTKSNQQRVKKEPSPAPLVSKASDEEVEYDSDVLEDYDPAPVPILIPSPPKKPVTAPAASAARRRRHSDSSEEEWSPRKRSGGGGSGSGAASTSPSTSSSKKKAKIDSGIGSSSSSSSTSRRNHAATSVEPPKKSPSRLKVPDLDTSVQIVSFSGKTLSFRLRKKREGMMGLPQINSY